MPSKRTVLEVLSRDTLLELVDAFELESGDRRVKQNLIDALGASRRSTLPEILDLLRRDELKAVCRSLGLDDSGRAKADIAARILGRKPPDAPAPPSTRQPKRSAAPAAESKQSTRMNKRGPKKQEASQASLGFENKLWEAADLLRNNMDPAEDKHVVLGLLFLKYIADAFEERRQAMRQTVADPASEYYVEEPQERDAELEDLLEDRDEYTAENVF